MRRVLTLKFATGAFDTPYTDPAAVAGGALNSATNKQLAWEAAVQGTVLLKVRDRLRPRPTSSRR